MIRSNKWWILLVVGIGSFMSALDTSIVNVALPVIASSTRSTVAAVEWVSLAYLITTSASVLVFGRLADIYGTRTIYLLGKALFIIASFFCGIAGHIGVLIAARVLQALGAAMIFALSPGLIVEAFPTHERGRALGMQATLTYFGIAVGPVLGGMLIRWLGWPSIFYVNVPVGLVVMWLAWKVLIPGRAPEADQPFDPAGASLLALTLIMLLLALTRGSEWGWHSPLTLTLATAGIITAATFITVERRIPHPAMDLTLFRIPAFSGSVLAAYLCYMSTSSVSFLLPFFLMKGANIPVDRVGFLMAAVPLGMMALTGPSGWLSDKVGVRLPATLGMIFITTGTLLLSRMTLNFTTPWLISALAISGIGAGLFTAPNNSALMGAAPPHRRGVAGAILAAARTVGFASGIAMAGLIYTTITAKQGDTPEGISLAVRAGLSATIFTAAAGAACSAVRPSRAT